MRKVISALFVTVFFIALTNCFSQQVEMFDETAEVDPSVVLEKDSGGPTFEPVKNDAGAATSISKDKENPQLSGDKYLINRGDCLWDLSYKFYDTPWRWRDIYNANPYIQNPNLIFPHDKLVIPGYPAGAKAVTGKREASGSAAAAADERLPEAKQQAAGAGAQESEDDVYEEVAVEEAVIPPELSGYTDTTKGKYMEESFIIPDDWEFDGYVVGAAEKKLMIASGDIIFVDAGTNSGIKPGTRCGIYRLGKNIRGKGTSRKIGRVVRRIAVVEATGDIESDVSTVRVISCNDYIVKGDMVRIMN